MKRSITRFLSICIFLSVPSFINGQNIEFADSLFEAGDFLYARVAYERLLFQGKEDVGLLLLKKSFCLKAEGKFEEAYTTLQRVDLFKESDSVRIKLYHELALDAYLARKFDQSISTLEELHYYFPNESTSISDALEILSLNQLAKWDAAKQKFEAFLSKYQLPDQDLYKKKNLPSLKNPTKAETLSYLIPGSGQLYAGYPGRAITSIVLQGGLVVFTVYSFTNGYYLSGAFTGVGLFSLFYNGGAGQARDLAIKHNEKEFAEFNNKVKAALSAVDKK